MTNAASTARVRSPDPPEIDETTVRPVAVRNRYYRGILVDALEDGVRPFSVPRSPQRKRKTRKSASSFELYMKSPVSLPHTSDRKSSTTWINRVNVPYR